MMEDISTLFQALFRDSPIGICIYDINGNLVDINSACLNIFGVKDASQISFKLFESINFEQKNDLLAGKTVSCEYSFNRSRMREQEKSNSDKPDIIYLNIIIKPIYNSTDQMVSHYMAAVQEITEHKRAEEAFKESEASYISLFENNHAVMLIINPSDGRIVDANPAACIYYGWSREELKQMKIFDINTLPQEVTVKEMELARLRKHYHFLFSHRRSDGSIRDVEVFSGPIKIRRKTLLFSIIFDITDRKRSEEQIRLLGSIADAAPATIIVHDMDGYFLYANEQCYKTYGYSKEEFMSLDLHDIHAKKSIELFQSTMQMIMKDGQASFETLHCRKDGSILPMHVFAKIIKWAGKDAVLSVSTDMTERKQTEEYISRTQRLESLGVLAGGIAHDFNNLLSIIFGYIDLARSECSANDEITEYLDKALNGFIRARDLTQQLLTFARGGSPVRKTASLSPLLKESVRFALSGSNITSRFEIDKDLWLCDFDINQIGQVIDNIIINAQQSMPMGGVITVSATNFSLKAGENPGLKEGNYVRMSFKDTGIGIPATILPRIFDPFFTTKQKGNGLGLSTAYSIVKKHDGDISVESNADNGATFHVLIPASINQPSLDTAEKISEHRGTGSILIMDDEPLILDMLGNMLTSMGYNVVAVPDGLKAIEAFTEALNSGTKFKAVIMDITIPGGMGGKEAIQELRNLNSEVTAFASSGYSDDPVMSNPMEYGFTDSIPKPYNKNELVELLDRHFI